MALLANPADGDHIIIAHDGPLYNAQLSVSGRDRAGPQIIALTLFHDHHALVKAADDVHLPGIKVRQQHFLLQNGGRIGVQLIHDAGIGLQFLQRQHGLFCQRMGFVDEHIWLAVDQRVKFQMVVPKNTVHVLAAAVTDKEDAQLCGLVRHLLDDLRPLSH